ncbi:MAG: LemA family protein [Candidatus Micrarchaeota archaeon]
MFEFLGLFGCLGFVGVVVALLVAVYLFSVYNGLITLRNQIDKSWSNIDVLLKQRSDLLPNLIETVKGYMKYEKETLTELTTLRTSMMQAQGPAAKAKPSDAISTALKTVFAVAENYPKLRANENFLKLQDTLTVLENQIADRREFYNDSVFLYNTRIHSLPDTIVAMLLSMKDFEYFKATEDEKKNVEVKL